MAKRKKNRKASLSQLRDKLANIKERSINCLAMAVGRFRSTKMVKRNKKRAKDKKNHWSKDWE